MKKTLALVFSVLFTCSLFGQSYVPFPDSNAVWHVGLSLIGNYFVYYRYYLDGDTLINGISYKKVDWIRDNDSGTFAIREDSLKRVYYYGSLNDISHFHLDSVGEYLLYDFGLDIGDTVHLFESTLSNQDPAIVEHIDSIKVDGVYRKRYQIANTLSRDETWIEGIGSENGLLGPYTDAFEKNWFLYCFQSNGEYIYPDSNCLSVGMESLKYDIPKIILVPNPAQTQLTIQLKGSSPHLKSVTLYDTAGQQLIKASMTSGNKETTITLENLSPGLYLCYVITSDGNSTVSKVFKL